MKRNLLSALMLLATSIAMFATSGSLVAQNRIEDFDMPAIPRIPGGRFPGLGTIMDMQVMSSNHANRSVQMTIENGVKKIRGSEDGLKAYIEQDPDGSILVKVTKRYTRDDLEELQQKHPGLYMHLKSMPTEDDGAEVAVSVEVTTKHEAFDEEDLQKQHPEAFEVYEKFTTGSGGVRTIGGEFGDLQIMIPDMRELREEMRRTLREFEDMDQGPRLNIDPRGIRIHDDPGQKDGLPEKSRNEKKNDKDT